MKQIHLAADPGIFPEVHWHSLPYPFNITRGLNNGYPDSGGA
jgi:hypothetical protein